MVDAMNILVVDLAAVAESPRQSNHTHLPGWDLDAVLEVYLRYVLVLSLEVLVPEGLHSWYYTCMLRLQYLQ